MIDVRPYVVSDEDAVVALWREAFPSMSGHNDPVRDIHRKVAVQGDWFFVATVADEVVGTAMAGYDGHRGWVYRVAVRQSRRGQGIGATLMRRVEAVLTAAGCPKLNLQVQASNSEVVGFYESLGYRVEERVSMGKRLGAVAVSA